MEDCCRNAEGHDEPSDPEGCVAHQGSSVSPIREAADAPKPYCEPGLPRKPVAVITDAPSTSEDIKDWLVLGCELGCGDCGEIDD